MEWVSVHADGAADCAKELLNASAVFADATGIGNATGDVQSPGTQRMNGLGNFGVVETPGKQPPYGVRRRAKFGPVKRAACASPSGIEEEDIR